jgi:hypothetical protein
LEKSDKIIERFERDYKAAGELSAALERGLKN